MNNSQLGNAFKILFRMVLYNMRVIFGNKFIWFLLSAFGVFILLSVIIGLNSYSMNDGDVFSILRLPGLLLVFYPTVFIIQSDADARSLEIIFGIPDYRFKIWSLRLIMALLITYILLFPMAFLAKWFLVSVNVPEIVNAVMPTIIFVGCLAFFLATLTANGNSTAVILVLIGFVFFIFTKPLEASYFNIFFNPFDRPNKINEIIWNETATQNRTFLFIGSAILLLWSLANLQKREKFLK